MKYNYLLKGYILNIADYRIRFESGTDGPDLVPADRFRLNIVPEGRPDLTIRVHTGRYKMPGSAVRVFHAPYVEEIKGVLFQNMENFWSVWKGGNTLFIKTVFPMLSPETGGVLKFSMETREWDLWLEDYGDKRDPLEYPLDGLILYYLTVINRDILIHSSGVYNNGKGYLFTGVSGKGKSTMAALWGSYGARVIHDDRLILRRAAGRYVMHNTPVYVYDQPGSSVLDRIFIIDHGTGNTGTSVTGVQAAGLVMANCVQQNWSHDIIGGLMESVMQLVSEVPVTRLSFRPDNSIIEYILSYEGQDQTVKGSS